MTRAKWPILLLMVAAFLAYWLRPAPPPQDLKAVEKSLRDSSRRGFHSDSRCETFFAEWDGLWVKDTVPGKVEIGRFANHIRQYPGVSRETRESWAMLAAGLPKEQDLDVSFAFGLSDCQFSRFLSAGRKSAAAATSAGLKPSEARDLASAILEVLKEVLATPVSRQALFGSVTVLGDLNSRQWLQWNSEDVAELDRLLEALKTFNRRADVREKEVTDKVFGATTFRDIAQQDSRAIVAQLSYSYVETEKFRQLLLPLIARVRLTSK